MDALADSHGNTEVVHIHNYSMYAIKSLSCEIKKFPIIYKDHKHICFAPQLTELAWTRIISAVLDWNDNFSPSQREYWGLSFRELWKWMRLMLVRDMQQHALNPFSIRNPNFYWLDYFKFVEKHICLDAEANKVEQWNPYIQVKMLSADAATTESANHTVIWLMDSREVTCNENEGISIRFQSQGGACNEPTTKPQTSSFPLCTVPTYSDDSKTDESPIEPLPSFFTYIMSTTEPLPTSSSSELPVQIPNEQLQEPSFEIDEDFQFTMSLLPKLRELEPKMNVDVKMQILQALHDSF